MIRRHPLLNETNHLVIDHRKVKYSEICAGFVWPGEKPGGVVVVGVDDIMDKKFLRILAEGQTGSAVELLKIAGELKRDFKIQHFYSRENKTNAEYIEYHNPDNIRLEEAPGNTDLIAYHVDEVKRKILKRNKMLFFFKGSLSSRQLVEIPDDISKTKNKEFPLVAALGYVVTAMERFQNPKDNQKEIYRKQEENLKRYDVADL